MLKTSTFKGRISATILLVPIERKNLVTVVYWVKNNLNEQQGDSFFEKDNFSIDPRRQKLILKPTSKFDDVELS